MSNDHVGGAGVDPAKPVHVSGDAEVMRQEMEKAFVVLDGLLASTRARSEARAAKKTRAGADGQPSVEIAGTSGARDAPVSASPDARSSGSSRGSVSSSSASGDAQVMQQAMIKTFGVLDALSADISARMAARKARARLSPGAREVQIRAALAIQRLIRARQEAKALAARKAVEETRAAEAAAVQQPGAQDAVTPRASHVSRSSSVGEHEEKAQVMDTASEKLVAEFARILARSQARRDARAASDAAARGHPGLRDAERTRLGHAPAGAAQPALDLTKPNRGHAAETIEQLITTLKRVYGIDILKDGPFQSANEITTTLLQGSKKRLMAQVKHVREDQLEDVLTTVEGRLRDATGPIVADLGEVVAALKARVAEHGAQDGKDE